jgi:hypothetical protein
MAEPRPLFADTRKRNLAILGAMAFVAVILAILALRQEASELAPKYAPETFLPGLASEVRTATRIRIANSKGTLDVVQTRSGWVLPEHGNYPAAFDQVQKTLVGLAALETIEPKTSRPDWFHFIGVDAPSKGSGTVVTVTGANGATIASVIFGKTSDIGDPSGAVGLFARRAGENQSWLLRSVFEPKADVSDWLDKSVVSIDRARISEVDVTPASGAAYQVRRAKPSDPDFTPVNLPKGRELSDPAAADTVASAITGFVFDDVRPQAQLDFSKATRVVTHTFDGLIVAANVTQTNGDDWATVGAAADPRSKDASVEAREIDARAAGWAYKLPAYKGQQFLASLESLLEPIQGAPKPAP